MYFTGYFNVKKGGNMIVEKNSLIEKAEWKLERVREIMGENSELFDECVPLLEMWDDKGKEPELLISDNFVGVNMEIYLSEDQSMKDVNFFLDNIPYDLVKVDEFPDGKWIRYHYRKGIATLHIFFHYGKSEHCKVVETGETKPVYKRVCV